MKLFLWENKKLKEEKPGLEVLAWSVRQILLEIQDVWSTVKHEEGWCDLFSGTLAVWREAVDLKPLSENQRSFASGVSSERHDLSLDFGVCRAGTQVEFERVLTLHILELELSGLLGGQETGQVDEILVRKCQSKEKCWSVSDNAFGGRNWWRFTNCYVCG